MKTQIFKKNGTHAIECSTSLFQESRLVGNGIGTPTSPRQVPDTSGRRRGTKKREQVPISSEESEGCALLKWVTPKKFIFIFTLLLLTCSVQGISYGQTLTASTPQALTEYNLDAAVVTLTLTGRNYEAQVAPQAVTVSGLAGVSLSDVTRESNTVLKLTLAFPLIDFDTDATLTFSVRAVAIANYNGVPLTAKIPVTGIRESLSALPGAPLTTANLDDGVVRLLLEGATWEETDSIRFAVTVSGLAGVTIEEEVYKTTKRSVWVCVAFCGSPGGELGRWETVTDKHWGPAVRRKSDTVLEVPLAIDGNNFDFEPGATLTFTVPADAIAPYKGADLTAEVPVAGISASVVSPLTETTLDGGVVSLTLTGLIYEQNLSKIRGAVTVSGITGVTVNTAQVQRISNREISVGLNFDGTDFDTDATLTFSVDADAIAGYTGDAFTAKIPVTAVVDLTEREQNLAIYWTDAETDKIQRANLDGSNVQDLVTTGLDYPSSIALDVAGGKMYWTDAETDKIQRANLDGSNVRDLVTQGLESPNSIALDVAGGKMYWTDWRAKKIRRANLDGSNVQDLVTTGLENPSGIALDVVGGKMYWTDRDTDKVQRANLNGSNVQDLVTTGLESPNDIALDVAGGKMYWTDRVAKKIRRANLDGSNVRDLVTTGLDYPSDIALDVVGGKMYWTDDVTDKIRRANLDGSNIEDLVTTGLDHPSGIAIGLLSPVNSVIAKEDVNRDGIVDVQDLAYVGLQYGKTGTNAADVNGDQFVDVDDLISVAAAVDAAAAAAPAARAQVQSHFTAAQLQGWLTEARALRNTSFTYQRGIAVIERLLALLAPEETALLANYPNPFNPETWIPYHLTEAADVQLTIYDTQGAVVRRFDLGHQRAGYYTDRSRAAYWDGRNEWGETVASGVFFYHLSAGGYSATRKLVILK